MDWLNGMDEGTKKVIMTVALLAAAVAAIILLYQKCEWFRDAVNAIWAQVKEFFVSA